MSNRPYVNYKDSVIEKKVDFDKWLWYQCIDLFKDYMDKVIGKRITKSWSAKQVRNNTYKLFDKNRMQIKGTEDLMQWDIIVSSKWKYWHIGIVDRYVDWKIYVLEQNWSWKNSWSWTGDNAIRIQPYDTSFWAGVWRCEKIFENLQLEREYIENRKIITEDYRESIRYLKNQ